MHSQHLPLLEQVEYVQVQSLANLSWLQSGMV